MADTYTLADLMRDRSQANAQTATERPISDGDDLMRHARGFGAGFVDPFGLTGYGARGLAHVAPGALSPETAQWVAEWLAKARAGSPVASAMGGMLIPGFGAGRALGLTAKEALSAGWLGNWAALGGVGGKVYDGIANGVEGRPGFSEFSDVWNQGGKELARYYMDVTRDRTSAELQPLDDAPY